MKKFLTIVAAIAMMTFVATPKWPNSSNGKWPQPLSPEQAQAWPEDTPAWPGRVQVWPGKEPRREASCNHQQHCAFAYNAVFSVKERYKENRENDRYREISVGSSKLLSEPNRFWDIIYRYSDYHCDNLS